MKTLILATVLLLVGCQTIHYTGPRPGEYRSTIGKFKSPLISEREALTDEEAGYDQDQYDECMDQTDTTAEQCEVI